MMAPACKPRERGRNGSNEAARKEKTEKAKNEQKNEPKEMLPFPPTKLSHAIFVCDAMRFLQIEGRSVTKGITLRTT